MINGSLINGSLINGDTEGTGNASLFFEHTVFSTGQVEVDFNLRIADVGASSVEFSQIVFDDGQAQIDFSIRILIGGEARVDFNEQIFVEGSYLFWFKQKIIDPGEARVDFNIRITESLGDTSVEFQQVIFDTGQTAPVYFDINIIDHEIPYQVSTPKWSLQVSLNSNHFGIESITNNILGSVEIEEEEGSARVATVHFKGELGDSRQLVHYVGADISINTILINPNGSISSKRMFTGKVDYPEYDFNSDVITLNCTDNLQAKLEILSREEILSLIEGLVGQVWWSRYIFDPETKSGWDYAQQLLSTIPYSFNLDEYGHFCATAWNSELIPDSTQYTEYLVDDSSIEIEFAGVRDLKPFLTFETNFRYPVLMLRERVLRWSYGRNWCNYLKKSFPLPSKDMITQAVEGTGWPVESIWFDVRPMSDTFSCPDGARIWANATPTKDEQYCVGFTAQLQRRWVRTITEVVQGVVIDRASYDYFNKQPTTIINENISVECDPDTSVWENSLEVDEDLGYTSPRVTLYKDDTTSALQYKTFDIPDEAIQLRNEDWAIKFDTYPTEGNYADFLKAFDTFLHKAATEILASFRKNRVSFEVPVDFNISTRDHIYLNTPRVGAKGKVSLVSHRFDVESGEATSAITMSISKRIGDGGSEFLTNNLDRPDIDVSGGKINLVPAHYTQIGGEASSVDYSDNLPGYSSNYSSLIDEGNLPEDKYYETRFLVAMPEVEEEATEPLEITTTYSLTVNKPNNPVFTVSIPDDYLSITSYEE